MDNFSEKFRQAAEGFSLPPSDKVWEHIEKDLKPKSSKRRYIFFLLPFMALALLVAGYSWFAAKQATTAVSLSTSIGNLSLNTEVVAANTHTSGNITPINVSTDKPEIQHKPLKPTLNQGVSPQKKTPITSSSSIKQSDPDKDIKPETITEAIAQATVPENNWTQREDVQQEIEVELNHNQNKMIANQVPVLDSTVKAKAEETTQSTIIEQPKAKGKKDTLALSKPNVTDKDSVKKTAPVAHRWSVAFTGGYVQSFSQLQENGDYQFVANYRNNTDKALPGYNFRLTGQYDINANLAVTAGIGLVNIRQQLDSRQAVYRYDTIPNAIANLPSYIAPISYLSGLDAAQVTNPGMNTSTNTIAVNSYAHIELPVVLSYNFMPEKKFNIAVRLGASLYKSLNANGYMYDFYSRQYIEMHTLALRSWNWGLEGGLSLNYKLSSHFGLVLEPSYKTIMSSIYERDYGLSQKLQLFTVNLGMNYKF